MTEQTIVSARSDALAWQAAAKNRPAETVSPAEFDQLRLDRSPRRALPHGSPAPFSGFPV